MRGSPNLRVFSIDPVNVGVTRTRSVSWRLPTALTEFDLGRDRYESEVLGPEDVALCGIASRGYGRGQFMVGDTDDGESEIATHFFQRKIFEALQ